MTCSECLINANCERAWKGTPRPECFVPGRDAWGTCPGCGMMRAKTEAAKFPCAVCAHQGALTPAQWAVVKAQTATHQAVVMENAK